MVADSIASGAVSEEDNVVERALLLRIEISNLTLICISVNRAQRVTRRVLDPYLDGELKTEETERFRILVLTLTLFECNLEGATCANEWTK